MGAFEFGNTGNNTQVAGAERANLNPRRLREECIIAMKVYDSCRQPRCTD